MLGPKLADLSAQRAAQKKRAAAARASAAAAKAWATELSALTRGTIWRTKTTWIEEASGARCAELVHGSTGKERLIRLLGLETREARAQEIGRCLAC